MMFLIPKYLYPVNTSFQSTKNDKLSMNSLAEVKLTTFESGGGGKFPKSQQTRGLE